MTRDPREVARIYGLPADLSPDELATVLEDTAAELRRGPLTHEESPLGRDGDEPRQARPTSRA
jgi:hypothetical protein